MIEIIRELAKLDLGFVSTIETRPGSRAELAINALVDLQVRARQSLSTVKPVSSDAVIDRLAQLQHEMEAKTDKIMSTQDYFDFNREDYCLGLESAIEMIGDAIKDITYRKVHESL